MGEKIKVLVVEDDHDSRVFIREWIKVFGHDIDLILSTDVQNSNLEEFRKPLNVDVVALDFQLIGITGMQILYVLREPGNPNHDVPVIFVPGDRGKLGEDRDWLFWEMNVIGIFQKPFVMNTVIGRIRDWARSRKPQS